MDKALDLSYVFYVAILHVANILKVAIQMIFNNDSKGIIDLQDRQEALTQ